MLKKISFGFLAHGFSIFIEALTAIVSIPLLLKYYSDSITGIWLFFLAFNGLILLGQCGLAPITARCSQNQGQQIWWKCEDILAYFKLSL